MIKKVRNINIAVKMIDWRVNLIYRGFIFLNIEMANPVF